MSIEVTEQVASVVETSATTAVVTTETAVSALEVGIAGPQGATGATGPQGPQGPTGPQGQAGSLGYVHDQLAPSATWTIDHNLGAYPNATVEDSAGTTVEGEIEYVNANRIVLGFSSAFAGKAYLS